MTRNVTQKFIKADVFRYFGVLDMSSTLLASTNKKYLLPAGGIFYSRKRATRQTRSSAAAFRRKRKPRQLCCRYKFDENRLRQRSNNFEEPHCYAVFLFGASELRKLHNCKPIRPPCNSRRTDLIIYPADQVNKF